MKTQIFLFTFLTLYLLTCQSQLSFSQTHNVCSGDTIILDLPTYTGNLQWQQSDDNITWNDIIGATYQPYQIIASTHQYFRAKVEYSNCNPVFSGNHELVIIPSPAISTHPDDQALCAGAGTNFAITATGAGLSYQWQVSTDGGTTFNNITAVGTNPSYSFWTTSTLTLINTVSGNNNYKYRCVVSGTCLPIATSNTATLTVNSLLTGVTAAATPNPICAGNTLTLSLNTTDALTWSWSGPNGFTSTLENPTITNITTAAGGLYSLTASNACGTAATAYTLLTVNPIVTGVTATATPNPVCPGTTLTLNGSATDATSWSWTGPNGFTSSSQNPTITSITAAAEGVYSLTASNTNCGSVAAVSTASVLLYSTPVTIAATNNSHFSFSANWNAGVGATAYYLDVSANSSFSSFVSGFNNLNVGNVTSYSVTGLLASTPYYYRVRAVNPCGTTPSSNTTSITTVAFYIGESYGGGIIFYIDGTLQHGLIAAPSNQSSGTQWGCSGTPITGADGFAIGTGNQNTIDIEAGCTTAGTAADICANLSLNGYTDWYLPSRDELHQMYLRKSFLGGGLYNGLWSSTEDTSTSAWAKDFNNGNNGNFGKDQTWIFVRAIRSF